MLDPYSLTLYRTCVGAHVLDTYRRHDWDLVNHSIVPFCYVRVCITLFYWDWLLDMEQKLYFLNVIVYLYREYWWFSHVIRQTLPRTRLFDFICDRELEPDSDLGPMRLEGSFPTCIHWFQCCMNCREFLGCYTVRCAGFTLDIIWIGPCVAWYARICTIMQEGAHTYSFHHFTLFQIFLFINCDLISYIVSFALPSLSPLHLWAGSGLMVEGNLWVWLFWRVDAIFPFLGSFAWLTEGRIIRDVHSESRARLFI